MDDILDILRRTDLRTLGRFLMEDRTTFDREVGEELTEKQVRLSLEDELRLALLHGEEDLDARVRAVLEDAWEKGKMAGFMVGMRVGARTTLSLLGEGEILI